MTAALLSAPAWVVDGMRRVGLPERGRTTVTTHRRERATPRWCPCGEPVWSGLANREHVVVDPTPTTTEGELFALLDGRRSFEMNYHGEMYRRRVEHLYVNKPDSVRVYIAHRCGGPHAIPNDIWKLLKENDDVPPF